MAHPEELRVRAVAAGVVLDRLHHLAQGLLVLQIWAGVEAVGLTQVLGLRGVAA